MATQASIVNSALELLDSQAFVSGTLPNFDGSTAGVAASWVYPIIRDYLIRLINPEFARLGPTPLVLLSGAGGVIPAALPPWLYEYAYPTDSVRVWSVRPPQSGTGAPADQWDPHPVPAAVAYDPAGGGIGPPPVPAKVILSDQANALVVYATNLPDESLWDAAFVDTMIRRLGQPLAAAVSGRFDQARELLAEAERSASIAVENGEL
jgi:hypothetical protein